MPALRSGALWRASLPMYNFSEMRSANAAFWAAVRTELQRRGVGDAPPALDFERQPVPAEIERE